MRLRGHLFALLAATALLTSPGWSTDAFASRVVEQEVEQARPSIVEASTAVPATKVFASHDDEWSFVAVR